MSFVLTGLCVLPVLVAGDPIRDVGDSLSVALLVPEAASQHDELPLQLPDAQQPVSMGRGGKTCVCVCV